MEKPSSIITLTTDLGLSDHYLAAVKGAIYKELGNVTIIDISHNIQAFNLNQAAFVLGSVYKEFPEGTVHLIGVDSAYHPDQVHIAMYCNGHYFVGSDNGIFSLMFPDLRPEKIVALSIGFSDDSPAFPLKDLLVRAAAHIVRGGTLDVIGSSQSSWKEVMLLKPVVAADNSSIRGAIIHIDHYGNAISNIDFALFKKVKGAKSYEIHLARGQKVKSIGSHYTQTGQDGNLVALFNSQGFLEIALYRGIPNVSGTAESLLGLKYRDPIQVIFTA